MGADLVDQATPVPMSPTLGQTLTRAAQYAQEQSHSEVALDHLLLALTEDADAEQVMTSSGVDIAALQTDVSQQIGRIDGRLTSTDAPTVSISEELRRILNAAAVAARAGRRTMIDGSIVLAAIIGDAKTSAAGLLRAHGLTFEVAINVIRQASQAAAPAPPTSESGATSPGNPPPPSNASRNATSDILAEARNRIASSKAAGYSDQVAAKKAADDASKAAESLQSAVARQTEQFDSDSESGEASESYGDNDAWQSDDQKPSAQAPFDEDRSSAPRETELDFSATVTGEEAQYGKEESPADDFREPSAEPEAETPVPPAAPQPPPVVKPPPIAAPPVPQPAPKWEKLTPLSERLPPTDWSAADGSPDVQRIPPPPPPRPAPKTQAGQGWAPPPSGQQAPPSGTPPRGAPPPIPPAMPSRPPAPVQTGRYPGGDNRQPSLATPPPPPGHTGRHEPPWPGQQSGGHTAPPSDQRLGPARSQSNSAAPPLPSPDEVLGANARSRRQAERSIQNSREVPSRAGQHRSPNRGRDLDSDRTPTVLPGQLIENVPRRMRVGIASPVEVRIAKAEVKAISDGLDLNTVHRHDVHVTKAMSVRLRAPEGGFFIETASPETQWIENALGLMADDYARWRWTVTPKLRGRRRLQLIVAARTVGPDGLAAETALPDQIIEIRVSTNYAVMVKRLAGWTVAAVLGGLLAQFGAQIWTVVEPLMHSLTQ